jgi:DNA-binding response OmpR family regulator
VAKILVVDDDFALADVLAFTLRRAGFNVILAHDGHSALDQFCREQPDLVVLDWMLPDIEGLDVCKQLRAQSDVPIFLLTIRKTDDDVVSALEAGADDYITKPFSPRQLVARVRAMLRRSVGEPQEVLQVGPLSLNVERSVLTWADYPSIHLTILEMRLMHILLQNAGSVLTTESLIVRIWGSGGSTNEMLTQLVYRLRKKLDAYVGSCVIIETIPRIGYALDINPVEL